MTQSQHAGERREPDQGTGDSRAARITRRRARDRVILTQPPPPPPEPVRPDRDDEDPPESAGRSAGDDVLATIDEVLAQGERERSAPHTPAEGE